MIQTNAFELKFKIICAEIKISYLGKSGFAAYVTVALYYSVIIIRN